MTGDQDFTTAGRTSAACLAALIKLPEALHYGAWDETAHVRAATSSLVSAPDRGRAAELVHVSTGEPPPHRERGRHSVYDYGAN